MELFRTHDREVSTTRPTAVLTVLCAGMFLVLLDVTAVTVAIPAIGADLRTGTAGTQWLVDGYTVAIASLLLAGGALGDRVGHRAVLVAGLVLFAAASIGCGAAPTVAWLVAARVVQGVGAALLLPSGVAALADAVPERAARARALGVWAGVSSLALPAGPLVGGVLVSSASWRWVFLINPPIAALAVVGVLRLVPVSWRTNTRRIDVAGIVLAALGLAALVTAVVTASGSAVVVAVLSACAFVLRERFATDPLLPLDLVRRPAFLGANAAAFGMNLTANGTLFTLTRYLQSVRGHGAIEAGVLLLPLFVPLAALGPVAGRLTARYGPRVPMLAGAALAGLGELGLLLYHRDSALTALLPTLLCVGVGVGLFTAPVVTAAVSAVPADRSGLGGAANNTARQAGTALGVAVFGSVAGDPARPDRFITGTHHLGVAAALAWVGLAVITAATLSDRRTRRVDRNDDA